MIWGYPYFWKHPYVYLDHPFYCYDCQSLSWNLEGIKHTGMSGLFVPETAVIQTLLFRLWNRKATNNRRKFAVPCITLSLSPCISFYMCILLNAHTHRHTDTQMTDCKFIQRPVLDFKETLRVFRGSPSDAFSHAMELLDRWTSWGSYAKTQGASKAV